MNFKKGPAWQIFLATSVLSLAALFPPSSFLSRPSQDFYPDNADEFAWKHLICS